MSTSSNDDDLFDDLFDDPPEEEKLSDNIEFMTREELTDAEIELYGTAPFKKEFNEFGGSSVGFCMKDTQYEKALGIESDTNFKMMEGNVFHHHHLPELLKKTKYGKAHKPSKWYAFWEKKFWTQIIMRPRFEKIFKEDFGLYKVFIHADIDLPACDRIIEFKTTGRAGGGFGPTDFLTKAYIMQVNAYATYLKRKYWEIWILHKSFDWLEDPKDVWSIIKGETDPVKFEDYKIRLEFMVKGILADKLMSGPETNWECKNCSKVCLCMIWRDLAIRLYTMGKNTQKAYIEAGLEEFFKIARHQKLIAWNFHTRVYDITTKYIKKIEQYYENEEKIKKLEAKSNE